MVRLRNGNGGTPRECRVPRPSTISAGLLVQPRVLLPISAAGSDTNISLIYSPRRAPGWFAPTVLRSQHNGTQSFEQQDAGRRVEYDHRFGVPPTWALSPELLPAQRICRGDGTWATGTPGATGAGGRCGIAIPALQVLPSNGATGIAGATGSLLPKIGTTTSSAAPSIDLRFLRNTTSAGSGDHQLHDHRLRSTGEINGSHQRQRNCEAIT